MKLVEDATVKVSGANSGAIGQNQIELEKNASYVDTATSQTVYTYTIASFIDAESAPRRGEKEVTYVADNGRNVIAYVPEGVADLATLQGKTVDVIFGKDNEVAYIAVTDDAYSNSLVTAWDYTADDTNTANVDEEDAEIEIDGEVYDIASGKVVVTVFGKIINSDITNFADAIGTIEGLLNTTLKAVDEKDNLTRNIVVDFSLNGKDEIETINFKFSADYTASTVDVSECVVTEVTDKKIKTTGDDLTISDIEDKDVRVIKNGEVATVADITVGNVITVVKAPTNIELLVVAENTVDGLVDDYSSRYNTFEIDGEEYHIADVSTTTGVQIYANTDGKIDEIASETPNQAFLLFDEQEVTAYLNMAGEVVALVGNPENTGYVLGVVMDKYSNEEFEDSDEVEYLKVKILAEDGSNKTYKIYNERSGKNIDKSENYSNVLAIAEGNLVRFAADADKVIKADEIEAVAVTSTNSYDFTTSSDVEVAKYTTAQLNDATNGLVDISKKTIDGKRYTSSTIVINPAEKELVSSWEAITEEVSNKDQFVTTGNTVVITKAQFDEMDSADQAGYTQIDSQDATKGYSKFVATDVWVLTKGSRIVYIVADMETYGASDEQYGIIVDFNRETDEDGERVYYATILVDGTEELTKEVDKDIVENFYVGDFVAFKVSDDEIKYVTTTGSETPSMVISKDIVEYLEDKEDTEALAATANALATYLTASKLTITNVYTIANTTTLDYIKVDEVATADGETSLSFEGTGAPVVYLAEDCVIYDLAEGEEVSKVSEGDYVFVADYDATDDVFGIVIIVK